MVAEYLAKSDCYKETALTTNWVQNIQLSKIIFYWYSKDLDYGTLCITFIWKLQFMYMQWSMVYIQNYANRVIS